MSFKKHLFNQLSEAPISDYDTVGDFNKRYSFRDKRDRKLIQHPGYVANVKKKFGKVYQNINLVFVNTKAADQYTEMGEVSLEWIKNNLGDEVYNKVNSLDTDNAITVVFTNNKGAQRVSMTPWIIAHRMAHALARYKMKFSGGLHRQFQDYTSVVDYLMENFQYIARAYNVDFPHREQGVEYSFTDEVWKRKSKRNKQLMLKHFFQSVGTFKSARDKKIREWFEVINELFAQYVITGKIKFNELPTEFGGGKYKWRLNKQDIHVVREAELALENLEEGLHNWFENLLDAAVGSILVM